MESLPGGLKRAEDAFFEVGGVLHYVMDCGAGFLHDLFGEFLENKGLAKGVCWGVVQGLRMDLFR